MSEQLDINEAIKACRFINLPVRMLSGSEMDSIGGADGLMTDLGAICDLVNAVMADPAAIARVTALEAERDALDAESRRQADVILRMDREVAALRDALENFMKLRLNSDDTSMTLEEWMEACPATKIARAALAKGGEG